MVDELALGIAQQIRTVYMEADYKLYTEAVEQGFKEPCFFIHLINQSQSQMLGNRYKTDYSFAVHYFPRNTHCKNSECFKVADTLNVLLEYIQVGGALVRGLKISSRIEDDVLIFLIDFQIFMLRETAALPTMKEVKIIG